MKIMLLCGGKGKRLWPLSTPEMPKQFLKIIPNDFQDIINDKYISMLQRTYLNISKINYDISIITSKQYEQIVYEQVENANIIIEPESRNTFPAIMLGMAYSIYEQKLDDNELVAYLPIDSYTQKDFYNILETIEKQMNKQKSNIGVIGIKPTEPSSDYGYIISDNGFVKKFVEKPDVNNAKKLLEQKALFNSGIAILRTGYFKNLLSKYADIKCYDDFLKNFSKLSNISFDYEILEKEKNISCVSSSDQWMDIGIFKNLEKVLDKFQKDSIIKLWH